ncbi:MAG TPA: hypothetical protein VF681_05000 [Abditibacteriaceae bacterium]|jgi:hypothetical protein
MHRSLLELQDADNTIARIKRERAKLDDGSAARSERDTLQIARDEAAAELKTVTAERTAKEDEQQAIEDKIARSNSRLMQASSAHEVSALERDLKGLGARRSELDDAILELMDTTETATSKLTNLDSQLAESAARASEIEARFRVESTRLEKEMVEAVAARERIATTVEPPSLKKYMDYAARLHGIAVAHIEKGNCSACGMALTPFNIKEAKTREWPTCESCDRLLYVEQS